MTFDLSNINPKFVDVDFREWIRRGYAGGNLGVLAEDSKLCLAFEESKKMLTMAECQSAASELEKAGGGLERMVTRIFNQSREGSCVGNASAQALQVVQARLFGKQNVVQLSAISLYKQIGRSPSSGAYVPDALVASRDVGVLPLDTPENRARFGDCVMPHTGFHTPYPPNWKETAKKFRIDEWFSINSFEGMLSALLCGYPVVVGRQSHAILYLRPIFRNGRWSVLYVNSWGQWGVGAGDFQYGFGVDSEYQVRLSARGAYAVCSVVSPFSMAA